MVGYYHNIFNKKNKDNVFYECRNGLRGCVDCKKELSKSISFELSPIREKRRYYEENPKVVEEILIEGTKNARFTAKETMNKVKDAMKINYFKK
ncbi:Tryptophan--tRNA ligase [compost metagenome]